ncbi:uncharacterized protein LOC115274708 isoform X1 [Suricata suricatta]|uniref:uncharacterized protein LOC115274708 isoform X1 n=1 Tax=Suricata suricatta TaxID=37032 RepID=UPI0011560984|nr:uncharacterized protein LOC115274708 isoform X1 [Suricata suricatta]
MTMRLFHDFKLSYNAAAMAPSRTARAPTSAHASPDTRSHGRGADWPGTEQCLRSFKRNTYWEGNAVSQEATEPEGTEVPADFPSAPSPAAYVTQPWLALQTPRRVPWRWSHGQVPVATTSWTQVCFRRKAPAAVPPPRHRDSVLRLGDAAILRMLYKWKHTVCDLLGSASFAWRDAPETQPGRRPCPRLLLQPSVSHSLAGPLCLWPFINRTILLFPACPFLPSGAVRTTVHRSPVDTSLCVSGMNAQEWWRGCVARAGSSVSPARCSCRRSHWQWLVKPWTLGGERCACLPAGPLAGHHPHLESVLWHQAAGGPSQTSPSRFSGFVCSHQRRIGWENVALQTENPPCLRETR